MNVEEKDTVQQSSPFYKWVVVLCILFSCANTTYSQSPLNEAGTPFVKFFAPSDYKNHDENFAITQDKRGVMYFGNFAGVLEYDGISWRLITTTNQTKVSALYCSKSGIVYVGNRDEFGYLKPDASGLLTFESLSKNITSSIGQIDKIIEQKDNIFFISSSKIFQLSNNRIKEIKLGGAIESIYPAGNNFLVHQQDNTISILDGNSFKVLNKFTFEAKDVIDIVSNGSDTTLIVTQENGIYNLINGKISKSIIGLENSTLTTVLPLKNGLFAIWSSKKGLLFIDSKGILSKTKNYIDEIAGTRVNCLFKDKDQNFWFALDNGIAQVSTDSPITLFSSAESEIGNVNNIVRYANKLYIATNKGLFYLNQSRFLPVAGINAGCWALAPVKNSLFVASSNGVYQLTSPSSAPQRITKDFSFCFFLYKNNPIQLFVGLREGLGEINVSSANVSYQQREKIDDNVINIVADDEGDLWLETISSGVFRFNVVNKTLTNYHYTSPDASLTRVGNKLVNTPYGLLLYNAKGIFSYTKSIDTFLPTTFLNSGSQKDKFNTHWFALIKENNGSYWTTRGDDKYISYYKRSGESFSKDTTRFLPIAETPIRTVYTDANKVAWFGGPEGVTRFNLAFKQTFSQQFKALIRKITKGDSVIFNGFSGTEQSIDKILSPNTDIIFQSQVNELKFDFSATSYQPNDKLLFQFYLDGFDDTWLTWTAQSSKEYTNLPPGNYTFRVKAKNIYGVESTESTFTFAISPPLYKRWWAILIYVLAGAFIVFEIVRWRSKKSVQERQKLENLIKERTEEVVDQKMELERQSEELAAKNDQLEKIDLIVQSINAEVDFSNLFQTILSKFTVIRNMDNGSFLIYDKSSNSFKFRALRGIQDLSLFESVELTLEQAEQRYLSQAEEIHEDIYYKNDFQFLPLNSPIDNLNTPKSLLTIVIKNEQQTEAFILLENISRSYAFDQRDINMIRNLKEHLIAAYIKTRLLEDLENTLNDLKNTQAELIRQEKLASVGQLTKGIVDRILNPLNYVNNFSQSSDDLIEEVIEIIDKQKDILPADTLSDLVDELSVLKNNQEKIQEHSNSTTRILKDMQKLLREKSREFLETDLNSFIESKARTALQEIKTSYKDFSVNLVFNLESNPVRTKLLPYEFGQVVQNIVSNSYYTLYEKNKLINDFFPEIRIETRTLKGQVFVRFRDNGKGIPKQEVEKLFSPFFTTKPTSKGTGLGLFMVKDIIETHRGKVEIKSKEGEFTEILVTLPATLN